MKNTGLFLGLTFFLAAAGTAYADIRVETIAATDGSKTASVFVETNIKEAEVYLDGVYEGLTPLTLNDVKPGIRNLVLKKDKYYSGMYTIEIRAGEEKKVYAELVLVTGILVVENAPENAEIAVDGTSQDKRYIELTEGIHTVIIKAFGYKEKKTEVRIVRRKEEKFDAKLTKAEFTVSGIKPLKKSFNPENPEKLGSSGVSFMVSAPGTGILDITNAEGTTVRSYALGPFTTWYQTSRWDGRSADGSLLPDGTYTIRLTASPAEKNSTDSAASDTTIAKETDLVTSIRIDRSIVYPYTAPWIGVGSSGPVVSGSLMPSNGVMVFADALFSSNGFSPALSTVVGLTDYLEAGLRTGILIDNGSADGISVSAGLKAGLPGKHLKPALALHYTAGDGISFGPAVEYRWRSFAAGGNAEITVGDRNGYFNDPFVSASTGLALRYIGGSFSGSLWTDARTARSGKNFGWPGIFGAGASAQWIIPSTNLVLSGETGYFIYPDSANVLSGRVAFGFLF